MSLRGRDLIAAAVARSQGNVRSAPTRGEYISLDPGTVRWATGAGAPAFGARPLPERHRPGFAIATERQGMAYHPAMYMPRFGAQVLSPADIQELLQLMQAALASVPASGADTFTSTAPGGGGFSSVGPRPGLLTKKTPLRAKTTPSQLQALVAIDQSLRISR